MDTKLIGPSVAGQNRDETGKYKGKGLEEKGHFVRLTPKLKGQIKRLGLNQVNFADLCRMALDTYLDNCEVTGDHPPLPDIKKIPPRPPRIEFSEGEIVATNEGKGRVVSFCRGWYRIELLGKDKQLIFERAKNLKKI